MSKKIFYTKNISQISQEDQSNGLKRTLSASNLVALGVGALNERTT